MDDGAEILGSLSNVNGKITLTSAHVGTGIKTVNGGISITGASHVEGGIVVERPGTQLIQITHDVPRIVIGPGATVQGELRFERTGATLRQRQSDHRQSDGSHAHQL